MKGAFKYGSTTDRYEFNHEYGFGMVDAKAAVDLAPGWTNVRDLREITSESGVINLAIPDLPSSGTPTTVTASLTVEPYVDFVEFVEVNAHFNHPYFRDLTVELVSPSGAVSTLSTTAFEIRGVDHQVPLWFGPAPGRGSGWRMDAADQGRSERKYRESQVVGPHHLRPRLHSGRARNRHGDSGERHANYRLERSYRHR